LIAEHFEDLGRDCSWWEQRNGLVVGAGASLVPGLALLPWCETIDFLEGDRDHAAYLFHQLAGYEPLWDAYWDLLRRHPYYGPHSDPRRTLHDISRIQIGDPGNALADGVRRWAIGIMFHAPGESAVSPGEWRERATLFLKALGSGAPFALTFAGSETDQQLVIDTVMPHAVKLRSTLSGPEHGVPGQESPVILVTGTRAS
jgi:hypothetical protein